MIKYTPSKFAFHTEGETLTEQEHKDSCDINKMIRSVKTGQMVRGGGSASYGYDDTTLDAVTFRCQKQQLEAELEETFATIELTEKDEANLKSVAPDITKKFKIRKAVQKPAEPNEPKLNDKSPQAAPIASKTDDVQTSTASN